MLQVAGASRDGRHRAKQVNDPCGWACTWECRDDETPAGREALAACKEVGGTLRTHSTPAEPAHRLLTSQRPTGRGASNRSRKSIVSSAPLGHNLSGGFFCALGCRSANSARRSRSPSAPPTRETPAARPLPECGRGNGGPTPTGGRQRSSTRPAARRPDRPCASG